jgi:hypothetical protein
MRKIALMHTAAMLAVGFANKAAAERTAPELTEVLNLALPERAPRRAVRDQQSEQEVPRSGQGREWSADVQDERDEGSGRHRDRSARHQQADLHAHQEVRSARGRCRDGQGSQGHQGRRQQGSRRSDRLIAASPLFAAMTPASAMVPGFFYARPTAPVNADTMPLPTSSGSRI